MADLFSRQLGEKKLNLLIDLADDVPLALKGDPLRLQQVLVNLTANAIKFTKQGEIRIAIRCQDQSDTDAYLAFTVSDTGKGISQQALENLFTAFTQEDNSTTRKFGGTGLGLTICKRLVDLMGGEISVASEPGRGTIFTFSMPLRRQPRRATPPLLLPEPLRGLRPLVIDAHHGSGEILATILQAMGSAPPRLTQPAAAMALLNDCPAAELPQILLVDYLLDAPGTGTLVRSLRGEARLRELPVIAFTAIGREEEVEQDGTAGRMAVVFKPVQPAALHAAILDLLEPGRPSGEVAAAVPVPRFENVRVLLVEDNPTNQLVASTIMDDNGIAVTVATNGREAIDKLRDEEFDAVLMDVQMPQMDGYEATRRIRANPSHRRLPIIAMTAGAMTGDREKCLAAGMNDYLSKPIDGATFLATLKKWLPVAVGPGRTARGSGRPLPSPPPPWLVADRPGLRPAAAIMRMDNNWPLYLEIMAGFATTQQTCAADIEAAVAGGDLDTARRLAHTVKGLAATLGMQRVTEAAAAMEKAARNRLSAAAFPPLVTELDAAVGEALAPVTDIEARAGELTSAEAAPPQDVVADHQPSLLESLAALHRLLKENNPAAEELLAPLRGQFPGDHDAAADLDRLATAVGDFRFKEARRIFSEVSERLGIAMQEGEP